MGVDGWRGAGHLQFSWGREGGLLHCHCVSVLGVCSFGCLTCVTLAVCVLVLQSCVLCCGVVCCCMVFVFDSHLHLPPADDKTYLFTLENRAAVHQQQAAEPINT